MSSPDYSGPIDPQEHLRYQPEPALIPRQQDESPAEAIERRDAAAAHRRCVIRDRDWQSQVHHAELQNHIQTLVTICDFHKEHMDKLERRLKQSAALIDEFVRRFPLSLAPLNM